MAQFIINIPQDRVEGLLDAFATQYRYQAEIPDPENEGEVMPNTVTKAQFAKNIVKSFVKEVYVAGQTKVIEETRAAMIATATADIQGVDVT